MKLLYIIILSCFATVVSAQSKSPFSKDLISMGEIVRRDTMKVDFKYTNNTNSIIVILDATTNCDCTWLEYPKKPVKPNETISLTAVYFAKDRGVFTKDINVKLSNGKKHKVSVVGHVIDK